MTEFLIWRNGLTRYLRKLLKSPEDTEDIVQESFVRMLEAGADGGIEYPKAYLYRTAHNLAIDLMARGTRRLTQSIEDLPDLDFLIREGTIEDDVGGQQRFELFCRAAAELPPQCRTVLILRKVYGYTQQEVSERMNIRISTVEKHLAKGLTRCIAYMGQQDKDEVTSHVQKRGLRM